MTQHYINKHCITRIAFHSIPFQTYLDVVTHSVAGVEVGPSIFSTLQAHRVSTADDITLWDTASHDLDWLAVTFHRQSDDFTAATVWDALRSFSTSAWRRGAELKSSRASSLVCHFCYTFYSSYGRFTPYSADLSEIYYTGLLHLTLHV